MWVSEGWKDYELLDCRRRGAAGALGEIYPCAARPPGHLAAGGKHPGWRRYDARYQRSSTAGENGWKKDLPERWTLPYGPLTLNIKPMNFKHTGVFPQSRRPTGTGPWKRIRSAGRPRVGAQPLRLHRRGHGGLRRRRGLRVPRGRGEGPWWPGPVKTPGAPAGRRAYPLDRGRLRQVCGAGDPPGPDIRRGDHGPSLLRPGALRGDLEAGGGPVPLCGAGGRRPLRLPLFFLINSYTTGLAPSVLTYLLETLVARRHGGHTDSQELGPARHGHRPGPALRGVRPLDRPVKRSMLTL